MNEAQGKTIVFMSIGRVDSNEKEFETFGFAVIWVIIRGKGRIGSVGDIPEFQEANGAKAKFKMVFG